jgi:hypothetical protein
MRHERVRSGTRTCAQTRGRLGATASACWPARGSPSLCLWRRAPRCSTASLDCDTNGLVVIVAAAVAGPAGGWAWAAWRRARGMLLAASVTGACLLTTVVGAAAWATVALDRCFTF